MAFPYCRCYFTHCNNWAVHAVQIGCIHEHVSVEYWCSEHLHDAQTYRTLCLHCREQAPKHDCTVKLNVVGGGPPWTRSPGSQWTIE